jgi:hypothetical protein
MIDLRRMRELSKEAPQTGIATVKKITLATVETKKMHTKDRLAGELEAIGLQEMADKARKGAYDDYLSESATNIMDLVNDLAKAGSVEALALRKRAIDGEFDATHEESEAWAQSPEGKATFNSLLKGK